jgi:hypothetical protein
MNNRLNMNDKRHITGGLAQAGQWLARKFVVIWKFIARPTAVEAPPAPSRWDVM